MTGDDDEALRRRVSYLFWRLPARARLSVLLAEGVLTDDGLDLLPVRVYNEALARAVSNGDLGDLLREIERAGERYGHGAVS